MRSLIKSLLGPAVESLFRRWERGITVDQHRALVAYRLGPLLRTKGPAVAEAFLRPDVLQYAVADTARRCADQSLLRPGAATPEASLLSVAAVERRDMEALFDTESFETLPALNIIQCLTLIDGRRLQRPAEGACGESLAETISAKLTGGAVNVTTARAAAALVYYGLKSGRLTWPQAANVLERLLESCPPGQWLSTGGVFYGTSYLLRALSAVGQAGPANHLQRPAQDLRERLLRHVEVKRRQAFPFRADSLPKDACPLLERLRLTLSFVEIAGWLPDARYLNAALKLNDWHYAALRKGKRPSGSGAADRVSPMTVLHYAASLAEQEKLLKEFSTYESRRAGACG